MSQQDVIDIKNRTREKSRYADVEKHPCLEEAGQTEKCMRRTNYDRNECGRYFRNYKNCQEFWLRVQAERRKERITPLLPPPEEREEMKKKYSYILRDINVH